MKRFLLPMIVTAMLSGCASFFESTAPLHSWYREREPAVSYKWIQIRSWETPRYCNTGPNFYADGCSLIVGKECFVWSVHSEAFAKQWLMEGRELFFEHEVWNADKTMGHCAGMNHREYERPSLLARHGVVQ